MADSTNTFQPVDIVQFKSGGALLTVVQHDEDGVTVYYSDANGLPQVRQQALPASVLQKITPPSTRRPASAAETVR